MARLRLLELRFPVIVLHSDFLFGPVDSVDCFPALSAEGAKAGYLDEIEVISSSGSSFLVETLEIVKRSRLIWLSFLGEKLNDIVFTSSAELDLHSARNKISAQLSNGRSWIRNGEQGYTVNEFLNDSKGWGSIEDLISGLGWISIPEEEYKPYKGVSKKVRLL
jgi:hypothetical protein